VPIDLIVNKEIQLLGSRGMPVTEFPAMLRMVAAGHLDPGKLVTRRVPLEETGEVIAAMDDYETLGFTVIDRF
jgi:threonine dehydrogenase-like Zn-dependent dehydrogenase